MASNRFLTISAAALFVATAATAADLPSFKSPPPPPPPPAFSWTGFFVGLNAGGHFGGNSTNFSGSDSNIAGLGDALYSGGFPLVGVHAASGFIGGGQFGYNLQISPNIVVGLEAQFEGATGSNTLNTVHGPDVGIPILLSETNTQRLDWLGFLLARGGFTPVERLLLYGTVGFAFGQSSTSFTVSAPAAFPPLFGSASQNANTGWAAGGGVEYAFTNNLSARVEYLHYDLGETSGSVYYAYPFPDPVLGPIQFSSLTGTTRHSGEIVKASVNYKFDFGTAAPVVAKF